MSPTRPDMQKEVTIDPWGCCPCPRYHVSSWTGLGIGLGLGSGSGFRVRVRVRVAVQELSCNRCPHWGMWSNVTYTAIASNYT